jgi:3(or 17)beta-hydroxysteroid dehydrogenase
MKRVTEKIAIVTGAANGISRASAELLAREGATVVMTDIDQEQGVRVLDEPRCRSRPK